MSRYEFESLLWLRTAVSICLILTSHHPQATSSKKVFLMYVFDYAVIQIILVSSSKITLVLGFSPDCRASGSDLSCTSHLCSVPHSERTFKCVFHIPHFKKFSASNVNLLCAKTVLVFWNSVLTWTKHSSLSCLLPRPWRRNHGLLATLFPPRLSVSLSLSPWTHEPTVLLHLQLLSSFFFFFFF